MKRMLFWLFLCIALSVFSVFFLPEEINFILFLIVILFTGIGGILTVTGSIDLFGYLNILISKTHQSREQLEEKVLAFLTLICFLLGITYKNPIIAFIAMVSVYVILLSVVTREINLREKNK